MDRTMTLVLAARDTASGPVGKLHGALGKLGTRGKVIGSQFSAMGGKIAKTGAVMGALAVGGVAALVVGLGAAVRASMEESVGIERLNTTLKNNIPGWKGNTDAIEAQIAAREKLAFSDDSLRDSLSALVARTHNLKQAQDLQATAMDLARAKGIGLQDATQLLVKVQGGQLKALKGLGISFAPVTTAQDALRESTKNATKEQIAAAKAADAQATAQGATAAIARATAGQAEAYAKTGKASFETFNIAIGDLVEDIGSALIPMATSLARMLTDQVLPTVRTIAAGFGEWVSANQPLLTSIASLVSGALNALIDLLFNRLVPAAAAIVGAIGDWVAANGPLIAQIQGALATAMNALSEGLRIAGENLNIVVPFIAGPLIVALGLWAASAAAAAVATLAALAPLLLVGAAIGALAVAWANDWGGIQEIVGGVVAFLQPIFGQIVAAIQGVVDTVGPLLATWVGGWDGVMQKVGAVASFIGEKVGAIVAFVEPGFQRVAAVVSAAIGAVVAVIGPAVAAWVGGWQGIQDKVAFVVDAVSGIVDRLVEIVVAIIARIAPVIEGVINFANAIIAQIGRILEVIAPIIANIIARIVGIVAGIAGVVEGVIKWVGDVLAVFNGPGGFQAAIGKIVGDVVALFVSLPGKLLALVPEFINAAVGIGGGLVRGVVDGLAGLAAELAGAFTRAVNSIFPINIGPVHITASGVNIDMPTIDLPRIDLPHLAVGGVAQRGRPVVVGERRPEVFVPDVTGRVLPRAGIGGSFVTNLTVNGSDDPDLWAQRYVQSVARRLRREGIID